MFRWLAGPGAVFRDAPVGSTNYLGAYTREGRPIVDRRQTAGSETPASPEIVAESTDDAESEDGDDESETSVADISSEPSSPSNVQAGGRQNPIALRPFPNNPHFRSPPVLDEDMREEIWRRVMEDGKTVKLVSVELGVDMNRVGAVVRLKEVEKQWVREGTPLVVPYARAILSMLPKTRYHPSQRNRHESINDLPVHPATMQQIFHPTSESRVFTRADAAKVFDPTLLPADARLPHPELIEMERENIQGVPQSERQRRAIDRTRRDEEDRLAHDQRRKDHEARTVQKIPPEDQGGHGGRWEWRFRNIRVEDVGTDGRAPQGTGWRYGVPHQDRKRGQIKIPTRVV